jgi:hypothetical protein
MSPLANQFLLEGSKAVVPFLLWPAMAIRRTIWTMFLLDYISMFWCAEDHCYFFLFFDKKWLGLYFSQTHLGLAQKLSKK